MGMVFKTLVDENFSMPDDKGNPIAVQKKFVLSLACTFQDGHWMYGAFQQFVWDNIVETALNQRERQALSARPHSALVAAAKNLRLVDKPGDIGTGSELAEAVLYGVMRHQFKAIPAVPKIFYKQNSQDNAKGADSVHITIEGGSFRVWLGEAKFYNSLDATRLGAIVTSVGESLRSEKLSKENSLICNLGELDGSIDDPSLLATIKSALGPDASLDDLKPKLHVPILLLHECAHTAAATAWSPAYEAALIDGHRGRAKDYFERQIKALGETVFLYDEITFHVVLVPVPSKEKVVQRFVAGVEFYKSEGS